MKSSRVGYLIGFRVNDVKSKKESKKRLTSVSRLEGSDSVELRELAVVPRREGQERGT